MMWSCLYEMSPAGARGNCWDIEGVEGHLSGNELVLYEGGERTSYPIREVFEEIEGEQILSSVLVDTDPPVVWENPFKHQKVSHADDVAKAAILNSLHTAVTEGVRTTVQSCQCPQGSGDLDCDSRECE